MKNLLWLSALAIGFITWTEQNTIRQVPSATIGGEVMAPSNAANGAVISTLQEQTGTRRMMDISPDDEYPYPLSPRDDDYRTVNFNEFLPQDVRLTRRSNTGETLSQLNQANRSAERACGPYSFFSFGEATRVSLYDTIACLNLKESS